MFWSCPKGFEFPVQNFREIHNDVHFRSTGFGPYRVQRIGSAGSDEAEWRGRQGASWESRGVWLCMPVRQNLDLLKSEPVESPNARRRQRWIVHDSSFATPQSGFFVVPCDSLGVGARCGLGSGP